MPCACSRVSLALVLVAAGRVPVAAGWAAAGLSGPAGLTGRASSRAEAPREERGPLGAVGQGGAVAEDIGRGQAAAAPGWARALLGAVAAILVVATARPGAALAEAEVGVYFGQGCFWHVQHDLVKQEVNELGRTGETVTALAGYAGGTAVGDKGRVCYHNLALAPDYGQLGHTEVVGLSVPESKVGVFAKSYLDAAARYRFGRPDPQDLGTEYRSAIGLPGGVNSPLFKEIEAANAGRLELLPGKGNDPDTVGTKKVWIYDTNEFPFHRGEVYHQFHDDMIEKYSEGYHKLKGVLQKRGVLEPVGCPELGF